MGNFKNFFKKIGDRITAKTYFGLLQGNLPVESENWGGNSFLNANEISLYTNRAIAKRAEKVGEVEFILRDTKGNEVKHPLLDLLYKPNKIFTGRQFWALAQKYYDLVGEVFIYIEKGKTEIYQPTKIQGLHLLIPTMVEKKFNNDGTINEFIYKTKDSETKYNTDDVIYFNNPDPKSPLNGISLLKAGINAIQTETQINTYHSRILKNGGKVEGVFKFKTGNLSKDQLEDVKDKYQKEYAGAKKSGLPLFLGGDAEYIRTGLAPDELSFLEAKKMTLEDICILTGVPKSILASMADVKFDNADAGRATFLGDTIRPLLVNLTTVLDERLFPDDLFLTFVDPTPENVDQKLKILENGIKNYYMTINEAREAQGLDPVKDGDEILVPFNLVTIGSGNDTSNTKKIKTEEKSKHPNSDPEIRKLWGEMQIKRMNVREKKFNNVVKEYLDEQLGRIVEQLQPTKNRVFRKANLIDELLQISLEVKIGKTMFIPVLTDLLKSAGIDAMELAGSSYEFNLGSDIVSWIDKRADVFLTSINETTLKTLQDQFSESLSLGESRDQLVKRVQSTYGDITKNRAKTISRTEVHNATQYGTLKGYEQGGLTTKIWVAVMDGATRDSHVMVDGEEKPLNTPFSNGLMLPGDPNGPAEEVINCRCTI